MVRFCELRLQQSGIERDKSDIMERRFSILNFQHSRHPFFPQNNFLDALILEIEFKIMGSVEFILKFRVRFGFMVYIFPLKSEKSFLQGIFSEFILKEDCKGLS